MRLGVVCVDYEMKEGIVKKRDRRGAGRVILVLSKGELLTLNPKP